MKNKRGTDIWSFLDKWNHYSGPLCPMIVKFWLGGAFLTIFQDPPTFLPSKLYRGQSSKKTFLANLQLHIYVPGPCEKITSKLNWPLRYGGNKDNKTKQRLLNISAPGWPIWSQTSPMESILDIQYWFGGQAASMMVQNGGCSISLDPFDELYDTKTSAF